ncbi:UNVERIFIED_CONTAM: hypothetical protein FKN15_057641 [Acipenser sinensis]
MDQALKERQWELKQRAGQITKLDMTVREHKNEMEQKIIGLEAEVKEGQKLIESLEERLQFAKEQLQEKHMFERTAKSTSGAVALGEHEPEHVCTNCHCPYLYSRISLTTARTQDGECKGELEDRNNKLLDMDQALKERQWELKQRAGQITKLDMTVREHKNEMEQKIIGLEAEVKEGQKLIESLEERLQFAKEQLQEKHMFERDSLELTRDQLQHTQLELQEARRQGGQLVQELDKTNQEKVGLLDEIQELIKTHLREKNKFEMEALELGKQVSLAREQLQHTHLELQEAGRQGERLAQELDETIQLSQEKEANTIRLAEELGATQARSRQVEVQMQAKLKALQEEMEQLQEAHRQEFLFKLGINLQYKQQAN